MAQDLREEALLASGVDEAAAGEGCGVEGAEAGCADDEGEDEGAGGAEDNGAEFHGDGVVGCYRRLGQDEDVGDGGEEVACYYEGHRCMDHAGEVPVWVHKFAHHVVGVVPAVVGPETRVQGDGPGGGVGRRAIEPVVGFPVCVWGRRREGRACCRDDHTCDGDGEECDKFKEHENVAYPGPQLGGDGIEEGNNDKAEERDPFVEPG